MMLILASGSPRRQELLKLITDKFEIITCDVDEQIPPGCAPGQVVELLALRKAQAVSTVHPQHIVIGADTVVAVDQEILGKPQDREDAAAMLQKLSGRTHDVFTGVAICLPQSESETVIFSEKTAVQFTDLSAACIEAYLETGEPFDKAGAYGIQGKGALFISGIHGDYYNVMGLPVCRLASELCRLIPGIKSVAANKGKKC